MNTEDIGRILGFGFLALVGIAVLWFWIKMLIEASSETDSGSRLAWILVVFFGGILGAIVYSVVRLPRRLKEETDADDEQLRREMNDEFIRRP